MSETLKSNVVVLPVWLGSSFCDESEVGQFNIWASTKLAFWYPSSLFCLEGERHLCRLKFLKEEIEEKACKATKEKKKIAVFLLSPAYYFERPWFGIFSKITSKIIMERGRGYLFKIAVGGCFSSTDYRDKKDEHFWAEEITAHKLGAMYSFFNLDAPTAGVFRLIELVNRVLGADLRREEVPEYSFDDLKRIAWNISREDFNGLSSREGAIAKYSIVEDWPKFPF